jgi:guanylate kinase
MDDFVVDTYLRNNAIATWKDIKNKEHKGRYTTSLEASYFLQSIKAIIYNIEKGNNYYHRPKKARKGKESILLHGDAILTIIEGVGTTFLEKEKNNSISIFLVCKKSLEIDRRIKRAKAENKNIIKEIEDKFNERNSQYEAIIKPHIKEYDIILESL